MGRRRGRSGTSTTRDRTVREGREETDHSRMCEDSRVVPTTKEVLRKDLGGSDPVARTSERGTVRYSGDLNIGDDLTHPCHDPKEVTS